MFVYWHCLRRWVPKILRTPAVYISSAKSAQEFLWYSTTITDFESNVAQLNATNFSFIFCEL